MHFHPVTCCRKKKHSSLLLPIQACCVRIHNNEKSLKVLVIKCRGSGSIDTSFITLAKIKFFFPFNKIWAISWQNQQNGCAPSKDSDQLGNRPVAKDLNFFHADSEDWSDWEDARLIWASLHAHATLLVLSQGGSNILYFYADFFYFFYFSPNSCCGCSLQDKGNHSAQMCSNYKWGSHANSLRWMDILSRVLAILTRETTFVISCLLPCTPIPFCTGV